MINQDNDKKNEVAAWYKIKKSVHVSIRDSKQFYNGLIIALHDDFFVIDDLVLGQTPIYYSKLFKIQGMKILNKNQNFEQKGGYS